MSDNWCRKGNFTIAEGTGVAEGAGTLGTGGAGTLGSVVAEGVWALMEPRH